MLQFLTAGDLPDPGIEPASVMSSVLVDEFFTTSATWEALNWCRACLKKFLNW